MHLTEVVLDGFKSYGTRTVVSGFDTHFNAITGLNGSGKSNILDGICFVLGITNLSQVRANNLQELVYKHGQAGVTKASVSLVFNNTNKAGSPVGYEKYDEIQITRQVVIGGRNKYIINGAQAQQSRVQNLFHSVQLNVNNPHFLIMQGRITKVLNMKPEEILSMIEEAAGTRMYEMKKLNAQKTIAKKQGRVDEINQLLSEEITPQLETLRKQVDQYMQWAANNTEMERVSRFAIAYEYTNAVEHLNQSAGDMESIKVNLNKVENEQLKATEELEQMDAHIEELKAERAQHASGEMTELEQKAAALSKDLVKKNTELVNAQENCTAEANTKQALVAQQEDLRKSIEQKRADHSKRCQAFSAHEEANMTASRQVTELENKFAALSAGASASAANGCSKSLAEELADCKRTESEENTNIKQCELKLKHLVKSKKELSASLKKVSKDSSSDETAYAQAKKGVQVLKAKLNKMAGSADPSECAEAKNLLDNQINSLSAQAEAAEAAVASMEFVYSDPSAGFKRSKVKGRVAQLTRVKDPKAITAVEVVAGGRLYQVVVDSEQTGTQLLQKGKLRRRVTLIPLNKINDKTMASDRLQAAQSVVGDPELCKLALDLVDHDPEVAAAMKYVYGNTVICNSSDDARKATFDAKVRSVTLDGDIFDPSGLLTGGSRPQGADCMLAKIMKLNDLQLQLNELRAQQEPIHAEWAASTEKKKVFQQCSLQEQQLELLEQRMAATTHGKLSQQLESTLNDIESAEEVMHQATTAITKASNRRAELEAELKDSTKSRNKALKQLQKELSAKKVERDDLRNSGREETQAVEVLALEIEECEREMLSLDESIASAGQLEADAAAAVEAANEKYSIVKASYDEAEAEVDAIREQISSCDKTISKAGTQKKSLQKKVTEFELEKKKIDHRLQRFVKDQQQASGVVKALESAHDWIDAEKQFFGRAHTGYDFAAQSLSEAQTRLAHLEQEQVRLAKRINKKVMGMFEKAELEYQELMKKKRIIENDKAKIEAVIRELDQKKCEALTKTWEKVNGDFGSIFETLLPGTTAKLDPPEGKGVLDGLEVKVAFGGVWKQSLQELSGGQRSLLALSLVLAMLRFKPAPMYILDEVDAALDMSHTQNIGQMLKKHFPQSQFIVVSLKDGMFNNANVLFKTKFVDGLSTVMRTCNIQR